MNLIDIIVIVLLLMALFRGSELGFLRQLFSTIGFFAGIELGALLEPHVVRFARTPVTRIAITVAAVLGMAMLCLVIGEYLGNILKRCLRFNKILNYLDNVSGALLGGLSTLLLVWLCAVVLITLPYPSLQSTLRGSTIVSLLNRKLPPAPNIVADIGHLIAPNGFPHVFIGNEPTFPILSQTPLPTSAALTAVVNRDRASVVKIEGQGCGGIVEGSGFVVGDGLIATNAHVVAGIASPYVIDGNGTHLSTPIWFDPNLDFAVLRVNDLAGGPLTFNTGTIAPGVPGGVLGYPGGGNFTAGTAAIINEIIAIGRNIYGQSRTVRDVYAIQATVMPGNSGGPLIDMNGNVMGIVFATSTTTNDTGYALSVPQVINELHQAENINQPTSTGDCAE
jgi:S1-C subfamily serine protease